MQVENQKGLDALDDFLAVDGIDGIFIGLSDLAADMGFIGKAGAPEVKGAVCDRHFKDCRIWQGRGHPDPGH